MELASLASASKPVFRTQRFWLRTAICPPEPGQKKAMYLFNCAQRAHGNYLENQPSVAIALLVAGVQYPLWSAGLGAAWLVFRIAYAVGCTREDESGGEGRLIGAPFWFAQLGLFGLTLWT